MIRLCLSRFSIASVPIFFLLVCVHQENDDTKKYIFSHSFLVTKKKMHCFFADHHVLTEILMPNHLNTADILQLSRTSKGLREYLKNPSLLIKWMKPRPSCLVVEPHDSPYSPMSPPYSPTYPPYSPTSPQFVPI